MNLVKPILIDKKIERSIIVSIEYIQRHTWQVLDDQRIHINSVWHVFVEAFVFQPTITGSA